jgi:hypothetical protein
MRREIIRRALITAAVVGTILAAINHGPEIVTFSLNSRRLWQIGLTFLVPYCVSTYAATMQELRHQQSGKMANDN